MGAFSVADDATPAMRARSTGGSPGPTGSRPAAVQRQQLAGNVVVRELRRPTVSGGHNGVKGSVCVGERLNSRAHLYEQSVVIGRRAEALKQGTDLCDLTGRRQRGRKLRIEIEGVPVHLG